MLYVLPGMGATSKMYGRYWRDLGGARFIDWPAYDGEADLRHVALRLTGELGISSDDSVAGSSLGGIVALEIHSEIPLSNVFLVGSAINPKEINPLLTMLAPLAKVTPLKLLQLLAGKSPALPTRMFCEADPSFIAAMCQALKRWKGYKGPLDVVHRLHGRMDRVISCPEEADLLCDGGHLIALSHEKECVDYIRSRLTPGRNGLSGSSGS